MLTTSPCVNNFHPCFYKKHKAYACMPPVGTVVIDPIQAPDVIAKLGKSYFTVMERTNVNLSQYRNTYGVMAVSVETPVLLCGVYGNLCLLSYREFISNYRMCADGNIPDIGMLQERWIPVEYGVFAQDKPLYACHINSTCGFVFEDDENRHCYVNTADVDHGKGDFIVAENIICDIIAKPRLVNGWVFRETYLNNKWGSCLPQGESPLKKISMQDLPRLCVALPEVPVLDTYSLKGLQGKAENWLDVEVNIDNVLRSADVHSVMSFSALSYVAHILVAVYRKAYQELHNQRKPDLAKLQAICKVNVMTHFAGTIAMQFTFSGAAGTLVYLDTYDLQASSGVTRYTTTKIVYADKKQAPLQTSNVCYSFDFRVNDTAKFDNVSNKYAVDLVKRVMGRLMALGL